MHPLNEILLALDLSSSLDQASKNPAANPPPPEPIPLGPNKVVLDVREIENYINEQKKQRGFLGHKPVRQV